MTTIKDFGEFCNYVAKNINDFSPEGMEFEAPTMTVVKKTNAVYDAMILTPKGSTLSASINMNFLHDEFYDHPEDVFDAIFSGLPLPAVSTSFVDSYEEAKKSLFIRLCSKDFNEDFLDGIPYRCFHDDLVITVHLCLGSDNGALSSATVTNALLENWGVDADTLIDAAIKNSPELFPARILSMRDIIGDENAAHMWVVSNTASLNGAAVLAYPGILEKLDREMGDSYWLLPSSIHEFMIVPDTNDLCREMMNFMARKENLGVVNAEEWLSDRAYKRENGAWVY